MNRKLKIALKRCSNYQSEQGFALPIAIGMGLIMLLVGGTMIIKSQGDQVTASAQKGAAQSLGVAEGAIARSLATLNQPDNAYLLTEIYDSVNPSTNRTYLGPNQVQNSGDEGRTAVNTWETPSPTGGCSRANRTLPSNLLSNSIGSGSYQIRAYRYPNPGPDGDLYTADDTNVGALLLEGIQGRLDDFANPAVPRARIWVSVPIRQQVQADTFPGLYVSSSINLGNNDVLTVSGGRGDGANIICKDCRVPNTAQCSGGQPTLAGKEAAIGRGPNGAVDGDIYITNPKVPGVPTPATNTTCSSTGDACRINLGGTLTTPGPLNISTNLTLPRAADITSHKPGTPYHYVMTNMSVGNNTLTVNTTSDPVYLYPSGNVTLGGSGAIVHAGSPERFAIFGNPADPTNVTTDQQFTIGGGASTSNVFIFAPDATVGINGGSGDPDIQGAVWAKTWNGSSSNQAEIRVPDNMNQLVAGAFGTAFDVGRRINKTDPYTDWQRLEAN